MLILTYFYGFSKLQTFSVHVFSPNVFTNVYQKNQMYTKKPNVYQNHFGIQMYTKKKTHTRTHTKPSLFFIIEENSWPHKKIIKLSKF